MMFESFLKKNNFLYVLHVTQIATTRLKIILPHLFTLSGAKSVFQIVQEHE